MREAARSLHPRVPLSLHALSLVGATLVAACATITPATSAPEIPEIAWEEKAAWMLRLEDQRLLRNPDAPEPAVLRPATAELPAIVGPRQPSDLIRLLNDEEARVRRRAALALGRVGLPEAVEPLTRLLTDEEVEVAQMAAFALGLIGDPSARPALGEALFDARPLLQGRAAEALGRIGDGEDATAIGTMLYAHVTAGALDGIEPDEIGYPLAPPVEAVRLGLYALARLRAYDTLAGAMLDRRGLAVSRWWPVAYAFQRIGDPRAVPVLHTLMETPGRYTASFAIRGLAAARASEAAPALRTFLRERRAPTAVLVQSVRALAAVDDAESVPLLMDILSRRDEDPGLRQEAVVALSGLVGEDAIDLLLELLSDGDPVIRGFALRTLARVDQGVFMSALAGLGDDPEWSVRVALAEALGRLPPERAVPRLNLLLDDEDPRVLPAVLTALVESNATGVRQVLLDRLPTADFAVRATIAGLLADLQVAEAVGPLEQAYRDAVGDSTYVARAAILRALARLDPAAARPVLEEALDDREWAVRIHALDLLEELGVEADRAAIRPAVEGRPVDDPGWLALVAPPYSPHAFLETAKGMIEIELAVLDAPLTVSNFMSLARAGFFNGVAIHRLVPDFVVQHGDPRGDGLGGPGRTIRDEINQLPYLRGTVGMALDWEDTGGSQYFITHSPQPHLDGGYTVFGRVVDGMDVVDSLEIWDVVERVRIWDGVGPFPYPEDR